MRSFPVFDSDDNTTPKLPPMKTRNLFAILLALLMATPAIFAQYPSPTASASPPLWGCRVSNWNPEIHTFYGKRADILEKLRTFPGNLSERRMFMDITETGPSATVKFYERQENGRYKTWTLKTSDASSVVHKIDRTIVKNKGEACVGEECRKLFRKELEGAKPEENVQVPESPADAFGGALGNDPEKFVRITIILLC